jgi:hypothetical protein
MDTFLPYSIQGNKRKSKTRICAEPELERHVKGGLRKGVTRSTNLARSHGVARTINISERRISDESELCGITNHLEVTTLLLSSHGKLVPDVHPVTILTINALTTNLNLNLGNKLLTREIQPTSINGTSTSSKCGRVTHKLVDLRDCHLKICAVGKITITADDALHAATEIGLSIESLLNGFNRKVCIATVCYFPESNLRVTCTYPLPYFSIRIRLYLMKNLYLLLFLLILYLIQVLPKTI